MDKVIIVNLCRRLTNHVVVCIGICNTMSFQGPYHP